MKCDCCGHECAVSDQFCNRCGRKMSNEKDLMCCPSCGKKLTVSAVRCGCGHEFDEADVKLRKAYLTLCDGIRECENTRGQLDQTIRKMRNSAAEISRKCSVSSSGGKEPVTGTPVSPETEIQSRKEIPASARISKVHKPQKESLEIMLGQKGLLIAGVLAMLAATVFFLKYAFENQWVGPAGRVSFSYLLGIFGLFIGDRFRRKNLSVFGLCLAGGGISILYASTYSAFQIYHLIPQSLCFLIMIMVTVLGSVMSVHYDCRWLAVLALSGGFLTPLMVSTGSDNQPVLMSYMVLLNAGMLYVATKKRWNQLNVLCFVFTWVLFAGWYENSYRTDKFGLTLFFVNLFFLIHALNPFIPDYFGVKQSEKSKQIVFILNSFIALGYNFDLIDGLFSVEWMSLITVSYTAFFLKLASILRKTPGGKESFYLLCGNAAVFLVITVPILFSGSMITVFWAAQALILLYTGFRLEQKKFVMGACLLILFALAKLYFYDYSEVFHYHDYYYQRGQFRDGYFAVAAARYFTFVLTVAMGFLFSWGSSKLVKSTNQVYLKKFIPVPAVLSGITLFFVLNIEVSAFFREFYRQAEFAAVSVLWAVSSIMVMAAGFRMKVSALRKTAILMFAVTSFKVFIYDASQFSKPFRIVSFFCLALLLICGSYLYNVFREKLVEQNSTGSEEK